MACHSQLMVKLTIYPSTMIVEFDVNLWTPPHLPWYLHQLFCKIHLQAFLSSLLFCSCPMYIPLILLINLNRLDICIGSSPDIYSIPNLAVLKDGTGLLFGLMCSQTSNSSVSSRRGAEVASFIPSSSGHVPQLNKHWQLKISSH